MERLVNLQTIRKQRKLTRKELATLSNVGEQTIVALELGLTDVNNTKLSTLIALAKTLHCKVIDLLDKDLKRYIC